MVLSWTRHNDVPSTVTVDGYDIASICFMTDYVCWFHLGVPSPFLSILPSKTLHFHLTFPIFFLYFSLSFPIACSKLRLCYVCTASPYPVFFYLCWTCSPSLTAYRGIAGGHEDDSCPFGLFTGWFPCPDQPCYIWPGHTPSGFRRSTFFFQLSRYVWSLILCYLLCYLLYMHPSLYFLLTF